MTSRRFTVNEVTNGGTTNGFSFFPDAIRGTQGQPGPTGPQGPPGPSGAAGPAGAGGSSALWELTDTANALETAEDGTTLVRVAGEWIKNSYSRIAIGYGTNVASDGDQTIALGFNETGNSHIFAASSASAIAIGNHSSKIAHGIVVTITSFIGSSETTISVNDATGISDGQTIKIENELITIGTVSGNTFTGCTRGVAPSIAVLHNSLEQVLVVHQDAEPPLNLYYGAAGNLTTNSNSIAIGTNAGEFEHNSLAIAMGTHAGRFYQYVEAVAIGNLAGENSQGYSAVGIGSRAGRYNQASYTVAVGYSAADTNQTDFAIAIGYKSGQLNQSTHGIAFGFQAGQNDQGYRSIAIGYKAGQNSQGGTSLALGARAGETITHDNTIILNASGAPLNTTATDGFYVKPISSAGVGTGSTLGPPAGKQVLCYDTTTGEVQYFTQ